jgi:hypothetical protein
LLLEALVVGVRSGVSCDGHVLETLKAVDVGAEVVVRLVVEAWSFHEKNEFYAKRPGLQVCRGFWLGCWLGCGSAWATVVVCFASDLFR